MALVMTPIYTRVLNDNNTSIVTFNNIPQVYTDLKLVVSGRDTSTGTNYSGGYFYFNGSNSSTLVSTTRAFVEIAATPQSVRTSGQTNSFPMPVFNAASSNANTFGSVEAYIPNYTSANFKQIVLDFVVENNSAATYGFYLGLGAVLYRDTSPITSISIGASVAFVQNSTFSLYGIIRSGA